jgi:hypothetical protein
MPLTVTEPRLSMQVGVARLIRREGCAPRSCVIDVCNGPSRVLFLLAHPVQPPVASFKAPVGSLKMEIAERERECVCVVWFQQSIVNTHKHSGVQRAAELRRRSGGGWRELPHHVRPRLLLLCD